MPNPIKYTTGSESDALVKGNFRIGTGSVGKGPSDTTGYYQGPNVPSGGYVIYMNKDGAPGNLSYHSAANDAELISFTNSLAGQSYTTVNECFNYYYGQTDKVLVNQDYPANYPYIVMDGLVLNLDAGITQSYPGSGTAWTDVNGLGPKNNGTLTNGPTFNSNDGGSIVFDGTNDYITIPTSNLISGWSQLTYNVWVNVSQISTTYWPGFISTYTTSTSSNISVGQWQNTQKFWYEIDTTNGNFFGSGPGNVTFPLNEWFNVCMVYDGSNVYGYYNSTLDKSFNASGNLKTINSLNIGCHDPGTAGGFFNGKISISQIYNRALSATEVLQNFNAQKGRFGL